MRNDEQDAHLPILGDGAPCRPGGGAGCLVVGACHSV